VNTELVSPSHLPTFVHYEIYLGLLFGFAIVLVNVVAIIGPVEYIDPKLLTKVPDAGESHREQGCGVLFNYMVLADNTLQPFQTVTCSRLQVLEGDTVKLIPQASDFMVNFAFD